MTVHHKPAIARGMEPQQSHATLGKPGRAKGYAVEVHSGMSHVTDGAFNAGISRTESAAALQGYKLPTDPVIQHGNKITRRAEINPGSRSRNTDSLASETAGVAHARAKAKGDEGLHALGRAILAEARYGNWKG